MKDNLIWSNTITMDSLLELPDEELKNELLNMGYDEEMIGNLSGDKLRQIVYDDDEYLDADIQEFEEYIIPQINKQCKDGIVLLSGQVGRWDGNRAGGISCWAEDLINLEAWEDCDYLALYDDNGNLHFEATHHDGTHHMNLYALPEDRGQFIQFVINCMPEWIEANRDFNEYGDDSSDEEMAEEGYDLIDADVINDYCDFSKVPEFCPPVKNNITNSNESLEDLKEGEYTRDELMAKFGTDNLDIINAGNEEDVKLKEAKAGNPSDLEIELETLNADYTDFGPDGFYAVPFDRFKKEFPEFTNSCIMTFLKELDILTPEEAEDRELLNEYWQSGELIQPEDWPALFDGARQMVGTRLQKGIQ